jgi:hypothetical protein
MKDNDHMPKIKIGDTFYSKFENYIGGDSIELPYYTIDFHLYLQPGQPKPKIGQQVIVYDSDGEIVSKGKIKQLKKIKEMFEVYCEEPKPDINELEDSDNTAPISSLMVNEDGKIIATRPDGSLFDEDEIFDLTVEESLEPDDKDDESREITIRLNVKFKK